MEGQQSAEGDKGQQIDVVEGEIEGQQSTEGDEA